MYNPKCLKCGEDASVGFYGKMYCMKHSSEEKKRLKKNYSRTELIKKIGIGICGIIGIIAGSIVIYQFVSSL